VASVTSAPTLSQSDHSSGPDGICKFTGAIPQVRLNIQASIEKNSNTTLVRHEHDEVSQNACKILVCIAMGSEEGINALVSADGFTVLRNYISGSGIIRIAPFQVKKLLE
jgi:hypothetical protein